LTLTTAARQTVFPEIKGSSYTLVLDNCINSTSADIELLQGTTASLDIQ